MTIDEQISRVSEYAFGVLTPARYEHSRRTATTAASLCARFGIDEKKGTLAGIGHDICKDASTRQMISLASQDGNPVSELEERKPALLHGRAAAVFLARDFGITDGEVLEAVRCHTFGDPGMGILARILYVSDKIEPGREYPPEEERRKILSMDLNPMMKCVIEDNIQYLASKGREVSPLTRKLLESLNP